MLEDFTYFFYKYENILIYNILMKVGKKKQIYKKIIFRIFFNLNYGLKISFKIYEMSFNFKTYKSRYSLIVFTSS